MSILVIKEKIIPLSGILSYTYWTITAPPKGLLRTTCLKWIEVSRNEAVKGGLRTVQRREAAHASLMKARLRELGKSLTAEIPAIRREKEISFFASTEHTDEEKLKVLSDLFGDAEAFLSPVTQVIGQITEDLQTKEILKTILDDERESVSWVQGMYQTLNSQN